MSKLPGSRPPEIEVFTDGAVKDVFAAEPYHLSLDEVLSPVSDHHDYVGAIAKRLMLEKSFVATTACRAYADAREADEFCDIVAMIRTGLGGRR